MSYHKNKNIKKGTVGEFSKIAEEFEELKDAVEQDDKILILCEISDLLGAVELYLSKNFYESISFENCIAFSRKTQNAFREGTRKNSDEDMDKKSWTEEDIRPMCNHESWGDIVNNKPKSEPYEIPAHPGLTDIREKTMQAYVEDSTKDQDKMFITKLDELYNDLDKLDKELKEDLEDSQTEGNNLMCCS